MRPGWESIKGVHDGHARVIYWRYSGKGPGGAISRAGGGWKATGYGRIATPAMNTDLGVRATRRQAEVAVENFCYARRHLKSAV